MILSEIACACFISCFFTSNSCSQFRAAAGFSFYKYKNRTVSSAAHVQDDTLDTPAGIGKELTFDRNN